MLVRASSLEASMSHYLVQQIAESPTIDVRLDSEVVAVEGDEHLEALTLPGSTIHAVGMYISCTFCDVHFSPVSG